MNNQSFFSLLKKTYQAWSEDKATRLAASLSYYTVFALAPLLLILTAAAGLLLGQESVQEQIVAQFQDTLGKQGAAFIVNSLKAQNSPDQNIMATIFGFATLLLGALGIFGQLKISFDEIWHIEVPNKGFLYMLEHNLLSFFMLILIGLLLIVFLILSTLISFIGSYSQNLIPIPAFLLQIANVLLSIAVITVLFTTMFKLFPDKKVEWRDAFIGGLITAVLFTIGKFIIGFYLGHTAVVSQYGAAGSLIVILLWIYYSSQILFFGAEFTKVYAHCCGSLSKVKNQYNQVEMPAKVAGAFMAGFIKGLFKNKSNKPT
jgi:membrane protein